jgi:predicted glutamine amidotransferase
MGPPIRMSNLVTEPANSLINQSVHAREREEPLNGDGFGVAWYAPRLSPEPAVFRALTPAWSNANLHSIARLVESPCILAHVRAASLGIGVSEANCHPFRHGKWSFMHNGELGGFASARRELLAGLSDGAFDAIHGTTDSEHVFAMFLDEHERATADDPARRIADALVAAVDRALTLSRRHGAEHSYLNLLVCDGEHAVAMRATTDEPHSAESLYLHRGRRYVCEGGVCRMIDPDDDHGAVIVSSERLSDDPGWEAIPVNHIAVIERRRVVHLQPCSFAAG